MSTGLKFMADRKRTDQALRQPGFKFMVCLLLSLQDAVDGRLPLMFCSLGTRVFWNIWAWSHPVSLELQRSHALNIVLLYVSCRHCFSSARASLQSLYLNIHLDSCRSLQINKYFKSSLHSMYPR